MGGEDDCFGAMLNGVFDGGNCPHNTLVVGHFAILKRYTEVHLRNQLWVPEVTGNLGPFWVRLVVWTIFGVHHSPLSYSCF